MKIFFKNNRFISVASLSTLIISLILIFVIYQTNIERNSANKNLEKLKDKIQRLNYHRPSPTEKNIEEIKKDLKYVNDEISRLEEYFGAVYTNALNAFIEVLIQPDTAAGSDNGTEKQKKQEDTAKPENTISAANTGEKTLNFELKQNFIASWIAFIEKQSKMDEFLGASEVFEKFRTVNNYSEDKFKKAKNAFAEVYKQNTLEEITENNLDDYILAALGVPLDLTRISCKKFVDDIHKAIEQKLRKAKLLTKTEDLVLFNEFTTIPNDDQIPYIIKYCRMYEDLFSRIVESKTETLISYKKLNGLRGSKTGDFLIFKYELQIVASLNSARNFFDSLQNAYKDNRVYIIKDIALKNISSNVDDLQANNNERIPVKNSKKIPVKKESVKQSDDEQVVILLGASNLISMNIKLDYIIYDKPLIKDIIAR